MSSEKERGNQRKDRVIALKERFAYKDSVPIFIGSVEQKAEGDLRISDELHVSWKQMKRMINLNRLRSCDEDEFEKSWLQNPLCSQEPFTFPKMAERQAQLPRTGAQALV